MPEVEIGEPVLWFSDADVTREGRPAVVTQVQPDSVCVAVFEKDAVSIQPVDGVRHVSDPVLAKYEARSDGAWDYSPHGQRLRELEQELRRLRAPHPQGQAAAH